MEKKRKKTTKTVLRGNLSGSKVFIYSSLEYLVVETCEKNTKL